MFEIKNVDICVSTRYLIKNLNLSLNKGDKCAIIGEEGNGKSTLLKSILGLAPYATITGNINLNGKKIGYLKQNLHDLDGNVRDFLFESDEDYYSLIGEFYRLLNEFSLQDQILEQDITTLSGGELVKVSLIKILLDDPDILFLDEPTNDLDIESLEWLEHFINTTDKPILYVSHDETLLENTANMILHMEELKKKTECKYTLVKSSYSDYVEKRLNYLNKMTMVARNERRELRIKEDKLNRIMQSVHDKQNSISRQDPHGAKVLKTKMKSLKAQEARYENVELTEIPDPEESIYFAFSEVSIPNGKVILDLSIDVLKINGKVLSSNVDLVIKGPERVCIIGKNGIGKSTLIKHIYNELKNRNDIKLGYMPQNYQDMVDYSKNPLDFIASSDDYDKTEARKYLGNMKFTRDEMVSKIRNLSNGSIAKLFILKLVRDKANVLLLDEPTRNVSPLSNPVIREKLKNFGGTIISVSHDRKFINEVATKVYELTEDGLIQVK